MTLAPHPEAEPHQRLPHRPHVVHHAQPDPAQRPQAERVLTDCLGVPVRLESDPAALSATVANAARVARALSALAEAGVSLSEFALGQPSLDEVFLSLTEREHLTATQHNHTALEVAS